MTGTKRALEEIQSTTFEDLATEVLALAESNYAAIIQLGLNSQGKSVKSPVDGFAIVPGSSPPHYIMVQHTTTALNKLERKWLWESGRKKKGKDEGDIPKSIRLAGPIRRDNPDATFTLVLTTNRSPDPTLFVTTEAVCRRNDVKLDLWDNSRLARFLDNNPDGQYVRGKHLSITQDRLSASLLRDLCRTNCQLYLHQLFVRDRRAWTSRAEVAKLSARLSTEETPLHYILGHSGQGKSTIAYQCSRSHLDQGGYAIWIDPLVARAAPTVEAAIDATLRAIHSELQPRAGARALDIVGEHGFIVVIVDDVSRSQDPVPVAERVALWARTSSDKKAEAPHRRRFRLLCPLWPQIWDQLRAPVRDAFGEAVVIVGPMSVEEGADAVMRQSATAGATVTNLEARAVAARLGNDPFLIEMWGHLVAKGAQGQDSQPVQIIGRFIEDSLRRLSEERSGQHLSTDYQAVLAILADEMLVHRCLSPLWNDIRQWLGLARIEPLRYILSKREICLLEGKGDDARVQFRHDRIRDLLLADSLRRMLVADQPDQNVLNEPFYAEIIGQAISSMDLDVTVLRRVIAANPLALFHALRNIAVSRSGPYDCILKCLREWIEQSVGPEKCGTALLHEIEWALHETDSPDVLSLTDTFPPSRVLNAARLRNGHVPSGAALCAKVTPDMTAPWRDRIIEHAVLRHGDAFLHRVAEYLRSTEVNDEARCGALFLSGHIGRTDLASAIAECWKLAANSFEVLPAAVWAACRCCTGDARSVLQPVLDFWSAVSDVEDKSHMSPRREVAENHLRLAMQAGIRLEAVRLLVANAGAGSPLEEELVSLLNHVDDPVAVAFIASKRAKVSESVEKSGGFSPWLIQGADHWNPKRDYGRRLSEDSRQVLNELWVSETNTRHVRREAFRLWLLGCGSESLPTLRGIRPESPLFREALRTRMELGDRSSAPVVVQQIVDRDSRIYWPQFFRHCWCETLRDATDELLTPHDHLPKEQRTSDPGWIVSCVLFEIPEDEAIDLLLKHWHHLRHDEAAIGLALFLATPELRTLAAESIAEMKDPMVGLQGIGGYFGFKTTGRRDRLDQTKLESLLPYVDRLGDLRIADIAETCNKLGLYDWRRKYIDPRIKNAYWAGWLDEAGAHECLDKLLGSQHRLWEVELLTERLQKWGTPEPEIIKAVADWLSQRNSVVAFEIGAEFIALLGARKDLAILDANPLAKQEVECSRILENVRYRVCRRVVE